MSSLNKVMLIGNITKDPEVATTSNGVNVAKFGLATNESWKDSSGQRQERVEFHNIEMWRGLAEVAGKYLAKGSKVYIEGKIKTHKYTDKNGQERQAVNIVADSMVMLDKPKADPVQTLQDAGMVQTENIPL
jgi:single-strand DNA-binding protein